MATFHKAIEHKDINLVAERTNKMSSAAHLDIAIKVAAHLFFVKKWSDEEVAEYFRLAIKDI